MGRRRARDHHHAHRLAYFELYGLVGMPQSRAMRIVERFTPRDGGATLCYDFSANHPNTFTETVSYDNYVTFRWQPDLAVHAQLRPRKRAC